MPRKKLVRGDRVENAIREASRPFATTQDIAEALDVSTQAVRNNNEDLAAYGGLETGKVGRSRVYWLAENGVPEEVDSTDHRPPRTPEQEIEPETAPDSAESIDLLKAVEKIKQFVKHNLNNEQ